METKIRQKAIKKYAPRLQPNVYQTPAFYQGNIKAVNGMGTKRNDEGGKETPRRIAHEYGCKVNKKIRRERNQGSRLRKKKKKKKCGHHGRVVRASLCKIRCAFSKHVIIMCRELFGIFEGILSDLIMARFHSVQHGGGSEIVAGLEALSNPLERMPGSIMGSSDVVHRLGARVLV